MLIKLLYKSPGKPGDKVFTYDLGWDFTTDPECKNYDWLVAFEDIPKGSGEVLTCPKERTMFLTWEPTSVKRYSPAFTRQFGHLLTNRPPEADRHPNYHLGEGYFPWMNDHTVKDSFNLQLPPKTNLISTVCSGKMMKQTLHYKRFMLTKAIKAAIPELEWAGHEVKWIKHKYDLLDSYKYHIAIENHIAPRHWSEKITDSILSECLTFYAGDPELGKVLPPESFIPIPIDDPEAAICIIKTAIANNEYEKRLPAIRAAKELILKKYNFYAQIKKVIEECAEQKVTSVDPKRPIVIYSRKTLRKHNLLVALSDGFLHLLNYLRGGR